MRLKSWHKKVLTKVIAASEIRRRSRIASESSVASSSSVVGDEGLKGPQVVYENTYQLAPKDSQKFPTKKAEDIMKNVFLTHLLDSKYNSDTCKNLTTQITETVKTQVKAELGNNNRFKVVVLVMIGANYGQGARVASRCLWYPQYDRFAQYEYHNESLFAVGIVYGVYYE